MFKLTLTLRSIAKRYVSKGRPQSCRSRSFETHASGVLLRMRFVLFLVLVAVSGFAGPAVAQRPPPAPAASLIDINSASRDDLMNLDGIGEVRADAIIRARPFRAKTELVERRLIPESLYEKIADKVIARPVPGTPPTPQAKPVPAQPKRS